MSNYYIKYNNGKSKTIEGMSTIDVEERFKRITSGIIIIQEIIKIK